VVVSRLKKLQIFTQKKMLVGKAKCELRTGIDQNQYIYVQEFPTYGSHALFQQSWNGSGTTIYSKLANKLIKEVLWVFTLRVAASLPRFTITITIPVSCSFCPKVELRYPQWFTLMIAYHQMPANCVGD